jgi:nitrogen regulatory protein PII
MKLIKAVVRPNKVDDVKDALGKVGVTGITVTEVRGHGRQKGHHAIYRGKEYEVTLLPKIEMQVVVDDQLLDPAVGAIVAAARTGEVGDGRVFVFPIEHTFRIRTGEVDVAWAGPRRPSKPIDGVAGQSQLVHRSAATHRT